MDRRNFLSRSSMLGVVGFAGHLPGLTTQALERALARASADPIELGRDDSFWLSIRKSYITSADLIDLDNANTAPTPAPVFNAYVANGQRLRHAPSESFEKLWNELDKTVRPELASFLGAEPGETAFTPNATYALNTVIHGFPLERGDEILVTNHEYPDMVEAILQRSRREGIVMRTVEVPAPGADRLQLVERIERAITPRTKLMLISHVSAWSGEVLPVKEATAAAHRHNVAVLIDAAQSVGMLDVDFANIGAEFLGTSLHKWLAAPIGSGALLIKKSQIGKVWPLNPPAWDTTEHPLDLYEWTGTFNMGAYRTVGDALRFQRTIGGERKRERIRYLGDYWQSRVSKIDRVRILTPSDRSRSFGVAALMIEGVPSADLVKKMRAKGIIVQDKSGRHSPYKNAVRVSPGLYATTAELDRFVAAVRGVARG